MEEAPENGKESPHSAHANGINELLLTAAVVVVVLVGEVDSQCIRFPVSKFVCSMNDGIRK